MRERYVDSYHLKVWSDIYNRYIEYCHYTTLERVKEQINRYIDSYDISKRRYYIWKGNKPVDFKTVKYKIIHIRYKVTEEKLLEEEVEDNE